MIKISVNMRSALCSKQPFEYLTTGLVGQEVFFEFSDEWDGYEKIAVFKGSGEIRDELLKEDWCIIPHECLTVPGGVLTVGVYGEKNGKITPTIYCEVGKIEEGADPSGDESTDPSLPMWAQIKKQLGDLNGLNTEDKTNLVAAINEVLEKGAGGGAINGIPSGGKAGQFLCKQSDKDYDVAWSDLVIPEQYGLVTYDQDKTITIT